MTTTVETWAPAFARLQEPLAAEEIFSLAGQRGGERWCNLCETYVRVGRALKQHAKQHQRDLDAWRKSGRRAAEKKATENLREVNRERALEKKVLGRAPGDGTGGVSSPGGRHESTTKKEERMSSTTTGRIKPLSDAKEKKIVSDVETAFASKSEDFKKGAVVYARKLMKFSDGLRSSRPPVPPALQDDDREKTRATCASVAEAIGVDPAKVGLSKAATPAEDMADAAGEKVEEAKDEKTSKAKSSKSSKSSAKNGSKKPAAAAAKS